MLLGFSFLDRDELMVSSGLLLTVFTGLAAEEEDEEESLFLATSASPVFFFTLSLLVFTPSVFTLAFTFRVLSFFILSDGAFDVVLVEGLEGADVLLEAGFLEEAAPA